ncbi:hypothetical protein VTN00DRAFT_9832 [Thermoascus crustaceus]|uniref:uncharacterized protein n=1 Tax=Thermoascus crustaceus TaxID=5088 RepID=UPI003743F4DB
MLHLEHTVWHIVSSVEEMGGVQIGVSTTVTTTAVTAATADDSNSSNKDNSCKKKHHNCLPLSFSLPFHPASTPTSMPGLGIASASAMANAMPFPPVTTTADAATTTNTTTTAGNNNTSISAHLHGKYSHSHCYQQSQQQSLPCPRSSSDCWSPIVTTTLMKLYLKQFIDVDDDHDNKLDFDEGCAGKQWNHSTFTLESSEEFYCMEDAWGEGA